MRSLYWLRSDLRFHDNSALNDFLRSSSEGAFLYCLPYNFDQLSSFRQMFIKETLDDFSAKLNAHGFQLYIIPYSLHQTMPDLMVKHQMECLFYTREYTSYELRDEKRLKLKLDSLSIQIKDYDQQTLIHEKDLPFVLGKMPMAFGEFRKKIEADIIIKSPLEMAPFQLSPIKLDLPSFIIETKQKNESFMGGESHALARVKDYIWTKDKLRVYEETRNGMIDFDDSTKFSPWLANGSLSARFIYQEILKYEDEREKNKSTYWLFFELLWRDYFKFYSKKIGNTMFALNGLQPKKNLTSFNKAQLNDWQKWKTGQTGQRFIDANMKELNQTGWMSNRGRQNVASYFAKTLHLDWRLGAQYFEEMLIDYDPSSNWGNWNYVAGVGTDPRDRIFSPERQAQNYDPHNLYQDLWS
ncbi:MAG: DASH family cryptochrome [Bacteriovoracaceae bacterium]